MRIKHKTPKLLIVLILSAIMLWYGTMVAAQGGPVQWATPINISDTLTGSLDPEIVADKYGYIHVFWIEDYDGAEIGENHKGVPSGNTILYRRWDGNIWTEAIDLFITSDSYSYPTAAVDETGRLYLLWTASDGVYFSSALANAAASAQAWTPKTLLTSAYGLKPALLVHGNGIIDVIYSAYRESGRKDGNIYHIRSTDGGRNWTAPIQISEVYLNTDTLATFPRLAIDRQDRLHVAWYETDPPDYLGTAAFYARSVDNGQTWSIPLKIVETTPEAPWASAIQVATIGDNEVHLTWVCGKLTHRCHQWSSDGGETWSPPSRVFGELVSLAVWDAITSTPDGNLFWIMQLRYPYALYYSYWNGARWVDPPLIIDASVVPEGHAPQITVDLGNQLDLVVQHQTEWDIWFIKGISSLSTSIDPEPTPTTLPTATATLAPPATPSSVLTATSQIVSNFTTADLPPSTNDPEPGAAVLVGIISAVTIIGTILIYKIVVRN